MRRVRSCQVQITLTYLFTDAIERGTPPCPTSLPYPTPLQYSTLCLLALALALHGALGGPRLRREGADSDSPVPSADRAEVGRQARGSVHAPGRDAPQGVRVLLRLRHHPGVLRAVDGASEGVCAPARHTRADDVEEEVEQISLPERRGGSFLS